MWSVLVIGTGFAGIGMGIRLRAAGITDFLLLERAGGVGGTWRDNHYPGAACDIESHLYSFSFEPYPRWSRTYAQQPEILGYLNHCVDKYALRPHLRLHTEVTAAAWDDAAGCWEVRTGAGQTLRARLLVAACGFLSRPALPDIPGLSSFAGKVFHTARWDDSYPLAGRRVGIIGTGASAIQIIPSIAPTVGQLTVFQRTPPWILPKLDRPIAARTNQLFRVLPALQQLARLGQYAMHELTAFGLIKDPRVFKLAERLVRLFVEKQVADAGLRAQLLPRYAMGCKRILISSDYYPALQRPNVELVTTPIAEIRPHGVATTDGREHSLEALILATGFQAAESVAPFSLHGATGQALDAVWQDGAEAYLGTAVAGFPNLFFLIGPNTGLGHNSMIYMIESQLAYVLSAIEHLRDRRLKSLQVRAAVQTAYNQALHARFPNTVWSTGCSSWYLTRSGKNTTLWPGFTFEFRRRTRRFDPAGYDAVPL
jgi:cation diffusion facilitator CzcD-associated flavoprotein CzcO